MLAWSRNLSVTLRTVAPVARPTSTPLMVMTMSAFFQPALKRSGPQPCQGEIGQGLVELPVEFTFE